MDNELAWLIENATSLASVPEYLGIVGCNSDSPEHCRGTLYWADSHVHALRFARRIDAVLFVGMMRSLGDHLPHLRTLKGLRSGEDAPRICEHAWIDRAEATRLEADSPAPPDSQHPSQIKFSAWQDEDRSNHEISDTHLLEKLVVIATEMNADISRIQSLLCTAGDVAKEQYDRADRAETSLAAAMRVVEAARVYLRSNGGRKEWEAMSVANAAFDTAHPAHEQGRKG